MKTTEEWERFKNSCKTLSEIIIFKFSPICAQSLDIEHDVLTWFQQEGTENVQLVCIDVINNRQLSLFVSSETGIKHESPQVIWMDQKGNVKYTASHRQIDPEKLSRQLSLT